MKLYLLFILMVIFTGCSPNMVDPVKNESKYLGGWVEMNIRTIDGKIIVLVCPVRDAVDFHRASGSHSFDCYVKSH